MTLAIDIISDIVCPWCFIGKRRLEAALKLYAEKHREAPPAHITWRPFQLNPDLPPEGMSRADYVRRKFGPNGARNYDRVAAVGASVGIPFAFDKILRQPNTVAAHSLVEMAASGPGQDRVKETLLNAYFLEGADLTDNAVLLDLAVRGGLDRAAAARRLDDPGARAAIAAADKEARALGVEGVPFFIFNKRVALSGAHEPETLLDAIEQSLLTETA